MRKLLFMAVLFLVALFFQRCEEKKDPVQEMHDEVMRIHDEVMPLTGDLNQAIEDLRQLPRDTSAQRMKLIERLSNADKMMFDWMGDFEIPGENTSQADQLDYYEKELDRVQAVADSMTITLSAAKAYLNESK